MKYSTQSYNDFLTHGTVRWNSKFSEEKLAPQFIHFFESGQRIKVRFDGLSDRSDLTGTIGVTTGWEPCFLLMRTSRSSGSPYTLSAKDSVVAVKVGRKYKLIAP